MLRIDLRALDRGPVETAATVQPDDPALHDVGFVLAEAVRVNGRLLAAGAGQFYWSGLLRTTVAATCRRCLKDIAVAVEAPLEVLFTEEADSDDPSARVIPVHATAVDLDEPIREELILAVPEYSVCRDDCRGLCPRCGKDLNTGPCSCAPEPDLRWAALEALRSTLPPDER
ncbi:MAG TPA: DUF177 domain-containing protein [Gemmatimonadales bacterium]|nr:DUF177 domain-containing protein [Gemmatimonadales bacterium]